MKKVFIDGSAGTTGLQIGRRLGGREDIQLLTLPQERRKDPTARQEMFFAADAVFLCLPDDAAREAAALLEGTNAVVLDASTAHRTEPGWVYGFPEAAPELAQQIPGAKRIAVPGCHASGFIALVRPLIDAGLLDRGRRLVCCSLTGYSGGGKKMIGQYEAAGRNPLLEAPRQYGLTQRHKHLKEMRAVTGLDAEPIFCPIVGNFYSGMEVTVPLFREDLAAGTEVEKIKALYRRVYSGAVVRFREDADADGMLSANALSGKDYMEVSVFGNEERILLTARYDNLGKGASGAAVQLLNLALGVPETTALVLE